RVDRAMILAAGNRMVPAGRTAEMLLEEGERLGAEVGTALDAEPLHLGRSHRSDAVEAGDWERLDPGRAHVGRDGELAVGLAVVRRELGQELVVADAGRRSQAGLLEDARPDGLGGGPGRR